MSARLIVLAALILAPAIALAGVRAEVSATVGDDGVAQVRRKVLASALTETLKTIINRHLPAEETAPRRRALSAIYKNASKYIRRYKIEAEGQRLDRYRLSVVAEVDRKRLFSKLEELGFEPRRLGAKPRVLTSSYADEGSAALAAIVTGRFTEEKISAAYREFAPSAEETAFAELGDEVVFEVTPAQVEALAQAAVARARHIACGVSLIADEPEEGEEGEGGVEGGEAQAKHSDDELPSFMQFLPPVFEVDGNGELIMEGDDATPPEEEVELKAGGFIVDALSGFVLGKHVAVATGRGPDADAARKNALNKLGSELYQKFVADLTHARWTISGEDEVLEVRIEGVTSPAQLEPVANALRSLTELKELSLARVEARTVVWSARGIDPGFGWAGIASHAELADAFLGWRVVAPEEQVTAGKPTQRLPEKPPKVLLGRFAAP